MGVILTKLIGALFSKKEVRILMVGLDNAGKTTILYKLKLGEVVSTIPTVGFNVETVEYKSLSLNVWDVGGQGRIRLLWKYYYENTRGVIFVVDGSDKDRIGEAKEELHALLEADELRGAALLVVANKQDVEGAMAPAEVTVMLGLRGVAGRKWHVQGACATSGVGLYEGLEWLASNVVLED